MVSLKIIAEYRIYKNGKLIESDKREIIVDNLLGEKADNQSNKWNLSDMKRFTGLVADAEILRKSFWWLYQKGWISKESVSEEDYRDLGLEFPDGYERFW